MFIWISCHNANNQQAPESVHRFLELYNVTAGATVKLNIYEDSIEIKNSTKCLYEEELLHLYGVNKKGMNMENIKPHVLQKSHHCFSMKIIESHLKDNKQKIIAQYQDSIFVGLVLEKSVNYFKVVPTKSSIEISEIKYSLDADLTNAFYFPYFTMQQIERLQEWKQMEEINEQDCILLSKWNKNNFENLAEQVKLLPYPFKSAFGEWEFENILFLGFLENNIDPFEALSVYEKTSKYCKKYTGN